jgi:hypothetical protein
MLPQHIKDYINDRFTVEDVVYELDLSVEELIEALDRSKVTSLKIFEAMYTADTQMVLDLDDDETV